MLSSTDGIDGIVTEREREFHIYIKQDNVNNVKKMISFGIDVNCRHNGKTPVCLVAHTGQMEMLELLIATEADLNKPDMLGRTPLMRAMLEQHYEAMKSLLIAGCDPNMVDKQGRSCLVLAVQQGSIPAIKLLVEGGCDLNRYEYGIHETALHHAVRKGNAEAVRILITAGVDCNRRSAVVHHTPLHLAAMGTDPKMVELLIPRTEKDVTGARGDTPIMSAAMFNRVENLQLLLKGGWNPDIVDDRGRTALLFAVEKSHVAAVQALVEGKCNVNLTKCGVSALHIAASTKLALQDDITEILLRGRCKVNLATSSGQTALHFAAKSCNANLSKLLLQNGADITIADNNKRTAFIVAVQELAVDIIKMLVDAGQEVSLESLTKDRYLQWIKMTMSQALYRWVRQVATNPRDLQQIARNVIRRNITSDDFSAAVADLPVPKKLQEYIKLSYLE